MRPTIYDVIGTATNEDLNWDSMPGEMLWKFWQITSSVRPIAVARQLFPTRPKGYVWTTKTLGAYASNKATAIRLRLAGNIAGAMTYEDICERVYQSLPAYAKW